jgi:AraC-like DNA-binding protein
MLRYRLHAAPAQAFPLNVRSAGHYALAAGRRETREPGSFLQLFWCVAGSGHLHLRRGAPVPLRPGDVFVYKPGEPHDLLAGPGGWDYRWLTFDGERHRRIPRDHGLARSQPAGPCPEHLFEKIDACLRDPTSAGELRASVLAYELLLLATKPQPDATPNPSHPETAAAAKTWLDAHFTEARLNVAALAARLRVHRASLHRVFTRRYGVPPVQYLARLRLALALELLSSTRLPVADVAVRCGLPDLAHFSKLVSRHTGHSPRAYRQRHALLVPTQVTSGNESPVSAPRSHRSG